ncbi:MAG: DUF3343 domain-containing protein [Fusobacteria bacterium]|nr:MAG: DUF3343 domain-containing protein [Fusobacteriota bacterium]
MKKVEEFNVISFESTHMAIKSEKLLLDIGLNIRIIPVPREITASCGLALKINTDDFIEVKKLLEKNKIDFLGVYIVRKKGLKKEIEKII